MACKACVTEKSEEIYKLMDTMEFHYISGNLEDEMLKQYLKLTENKMINIMNEKCKECENE
jgi:hypothetical protein